MLLVTWESVGGKSEAVNKFLAKNWNFFDLSHLEAGEAKNVRGFFAVEIMLLALWSGERAAKLRANGDFEIATAIVDVVEASGVRHGSSVADFRMESTDI